MQWRSMSETRKSSERETHGDEQVGKKDDSLDAHFVKETRLPVQLLTCFSRRFSDEMKSIAERM